MRSALLIPMLMVGVTGCAHRSPAPEPRPSGQTSAPALSCRAALVQEARALADAIQLDAPGSELPAGLREFAQAPVVTREAVARLGELRRRVNKMAAESRAAAMKDAARAVTAACNKIDSPEQRAQDAVDHAIALLAAEDYCSMLEQFTAPSELAEMKKSGRLDQVVARFKNGWGSVLMQKLKLARTLVPAVNGDGTITFMVPGTQDATTHPMTLVEIGGRWYFRE